MNIQLPKKGEAAVCKHCRKENPNKYKNCERPCSWLVSDTVHRATPLIQNALHRWGCEHHFLISTFGHIQFQTCEHCGRQLMRSHEDEEWTVMVDGNEV